MQRLDSIPIDDNVMRKPCKNEERKKVLEEAGWGKGRCTRPHLRQATAALPVLVSRDCFGVPLITGEGAPQTIAFAPRQLPASPLRLAWLPGQFATAGGTVCELFIGSWQFGAPQSSEAGIVATRTSQAFEETLSSFLTQRYETAECSMQLDVKGG